MESAATGGVLFDLGPIVSTPGALEALQRNEMSGLELLARHCKGDWGTLCEEDKQVNESALQNGSRIMSVYTLPDGTTMWLITDAEIDDQHHRQASTFLLPSEY
jgi:hypothetical protein